jgi:hypothetical protein
LKNGAPGNRRAFHMTGIQIASTHTLAASSYGLWSRPMSRRKLILPLLLCVVLTWLLVDFLVARKEMRRTLPDTFEATQVSNLHVVKNGFGPGANETGFAVIHLSEDGTARIAEGGIPWLNAQPGGRIRADWQPTPVPRDEFWMGRPDSAMGAWPDPTVMAVLDRYGHGFNPPLDHQTALDAALNAPGSFYAFGPGGLVAVVVPGRQRAYVFYAG